MLQALSGGEKDNANILAAKNIYPCPRCEKPLCKIKNKKGEGYFWGCSHFPDCKITLPDQNGQPGRSTTREKSEKNYPGPLCQTGKLHQRSGKKGIFWGCNAYPTCKKTCADKNGEPVLKDA
jgi:ssDNA-binding Zn-finger/Zn-ribbon topoisomerase 1